MFYSPRGHIGFVHYPKTAGTSLQHWFRRVFPDGDLLDPENPHLTVASSLAAVQERRKRAGRGWRKWVPSLLGGCPKRETVPRIVGVIRDPLAMLVSLYEYWRRHDFAVEPTAAFIGCARRESFHAFVRMAVVDGQAPTYEWFFDVGGPAWPSTRLINYHALERGLEELSGELGIDRRLRRAPVHWVYDAAWQRPAERRTALVDVLDLWAVGARVVVRRLRDLLVRDRQPESVTEGKELRLGELLRLVRHIRRLDGWPE